MTTIEKARLLIRVANAMPDGGDRRALLAWADEILSAIGDLGQVSSTGQQVQFPVPIFRRYKGKEYRALLLEDFRVQVNGKIYGSPAAAATAVSGHNENGWRIWRYKHEPTSEVRSIDDFRR